LRMRLLLTEFVLLILPVGFVGIQFQTLGCLSSFLVVLEGLGFQSLSSLIVYCIVQDEHAQYLNIAAT